MDRLLEATPEEHEIRGGAEATPASASSAVPGEDPVPRQVSQANAEMVAVSQPWRCVQTGRTHRREAHWCNNCCRPVPNPNDVDGWPDSADESASSGEDLAPDTDGEKEGCSRRWAPEDPMTDCTVVEYLERRRQGALASDRRSVREVYNSYKAVSYTHLRAHET